RSSGFTDPTAPTLIAEIWSRKSKQRRIVRLVSSRGTRMVAASSSTTAASSSAHRRHSSPRYISNSGNGGRRSGSYSPEEDIMDSSDKADPRPDDVLRRMLAMKPKPKEKPTPPTE